MSYIPKPPVKDPNYKYQKDSTWELVLQITIFILMAVGLSAMFIMYLYASQC